ncbi:hypothetical protein ABT272_37470 [Streptomyces sp900105245]|uniref:Uncharacterized protein n=1 Tax=Streptomyces sp. 900105245 TaxID=3154379 RepID=A0ABV1UIJ0_9ACTN
MPLRKRAFAITFLATIAFTALAPQALAAPMPWETSKTPTITTHHTPSTAAGARVTPRCAPPCYQ